MNIKATQKLLGTLIKAGYSEDEAIAIATVLYGFMIDRDREGTLKALGGELLATLIKYVEPN